MRRVLALGVVLAMVGGEVRAQDRTQHENREAAPPDSSVHGESFQLECAGCHTPIAWSPIRDDFDHASTGFQLYGAHRIVGCMSCHSDLVFHRVGVACADCHDDPVHRGELGFDCRRCHDESGWRASAARRFDHQQTQFPLLGRHATLDCLACHRSITDNEHVGVIDECFGCHADDYVTTTRPDHARFGLSVDCAGCHANGDVRWSDAVFPHAATFPLQQGHRVGDCSRCHDGGGAPAAPNDCFACHAVDYSSASSPPHAANGFPIECRSCHGTNVFQDVRFYAHGASGFDVFGPHRDRTCTDCHAGRGWIGIDPDCNACHVITDPATRPFR